MDNARIHHGAEIQALLDDFGNVLHPIFHSRSEVVATYRYPRRVLAALLT
jgi:hypothetical protein